MDKPPRQVKVKSMAKDDSSREERLARALRENLRRRKAQARDAAAARPAAGEPPADTPRS